MKKKITMLLLLFCVIFYFTPSINAHAKENITESNFDYVWYVNTYHQIQSLVDITNQQEIWDFYQTTGKNLGWEGRVAVTALINESEFDYVRYATDYPNVADLFGCDRHALYVHYISAGVYEGKMAYTTNPDTNAKIMIYSIANQITAGVATEAEKVKIVHDWLVMNVSYDYANYVAGTIPKTSYGITGVMLNGKSVCQGYALAFQYFMEVLGIESEFIRGKANNGTGWNGHGWNRVKLDGVWYYIDVTWDDPLPDRGNKVYWYKYFMVTDPTFGGDHIALQ